MCFVNVIHRYIAHECVDAWKRARPQVEVQWVNSGHVTGSILQARAMAHAIKDVLEKPHCEDV